ncbi:MAG: glycoside hydrolase family 31 protein [Candidatus Borkfalkiaceae bacterium]|nr:glycoside hydrolase family 31 protein [Christensenellaceae bacterium]
MLKKSLIAKTSPKANPKNVIFYKDYRVTVLADRLFRLEKSANKKYRDEATVAVWFRNMKAQNFKAAESRGADEFIIETAAVKLILCEKREDCRIEIDGKRLKIDNAGNLKGTCRTLDCCNGDTRIHYGDGVNSGKKVELENGVCSRTGVAVYDDSLSPTLLQNGEIAKIYADGTDEYIFAYGDDYRGAVKALYLICGGVPMVPRFALGNWWSRYHDYSDEEYLTLLNRFKKREIPLSVATIDMDWHYSTDLDEQKKITESGKNTEFYGGNSGWTGYSWNKKLFPDYKKFLKQVKQNGVKITLNLHPADGVRWFEDCYEQFAKAVGVNPKTGEQIKFDIFDPTFANAYFDILHHPYEKAGVDFWWIDWQQGLTAGKLGIDPLWALNHYHYLDNAENSDEPLTLSRYAGIGSHRYPLGFSGDASMTWDTLRFLPYFTATASNAGYGWWSHDIGGHGFGEHDGELYLRHVQFGVFAPINRYHCTAYPTMTKEPWAYLNGTGALAEKQMKLRHKLVPFIYSRDKQAHDNADMLIEPLYYYHQSTEEAYNFKNEYYFGKTLLVAPITSPAGKDGYSRVEAWLPKGRWTDIFTGDVYEIKSEKGEIKTLLRTLESIPVLAKEGAVLPLSEEKGNGTPNPQKLTVKAFNGNGEFELFEDGKEIKGAKRGKKAGEFYTLFTMRETALKNGEYEQTLAISSRGDCSVIPENRKISVRFENIEKGSVALFIGGKKVKCEKVYDDCVVVNIDFAAGNEYVIRVKYNKDDELTAAKKRVLKILAESNGPNEYFVAFYEQLQKAKSVTDVLGLLKRRWLPSGIAERISETF